MIPKTWQELRKYCEKAEKADGYCEKCFAGKCCTEIKIIYGIDEFFKEAFKKSLVYHRKEKLKKLLS